MKRQDDLATLNAAKPFMRSVLAFIIYLRYGSPLVMPEDLRPKGFAIAYAIADHFIGQLEKDLRA